MTQQAKLGLLAAAIVGGVFLLAGGITAAVVLAGSKKTSPTTESRTTAQKPEANRDRPGDPGKGPAKADPPSIAKAAEWTVADVYRHLRSAVGEPMTQQPSRKHELAAYFWFTDEDNRAMPIDPDHEHSGGAILVQKCATADVAKDRAGVEGERGWSWNRFLFVGPPKQLVKIKAAFKGG